MFIELTIESKPFNFDFNQVDSTKKKNKSFGGLFDMNPQKKASQAKKDSMEFNFQTFGSNF
jgi:hypothetical protein